MEDYYASHLSAGRLRRCYQVAPPRVKRYLEAEIQFVLEKIAPSDLVLELGCGYGRVLLRLIEKAKTAVGIDTSRESLLMAQEITGPASRRHLVEMNAVELGFPDETFDAVICIQNGISVFKVDRRKLMDEARRVARSGGNVLFSSYSEHFWEHRLEWFKIQADCGLIGEIDDRATGDGVIVGKDGFRASTTTTQDFLLLTSHLANPPVITEVDGSSVFCEIVVP